jgi:hypothetical protein
MNNLSPAALKAAMQGGTADWGRWGSARDHVCYVEPVEKGLTRRHCYCGCRKRVTHRIAANGVCLSMGCEVQMHRLRREWAHAH